MEYVAALLRGNRNSKRQGNMHHAVNETIQYTTDIAHTVAEAGKRHWLQHEKHGSVKVMVGVEARGV